MKFKFILAAVSLMSTVAFGATENSGEVVTDAPRRSSSEERIVRRIIPQAGIIWSEYRGSDNKVYFGREGYSVGALFDLLGTHKMVLETGALYRERGVATDNTTFRARYISIPVTAKYYLNGQENTSFYLKAGAMGSNLIGSDSTRTVSSNSTVNFTADQWELDGVAGVGMKFVLSQNTDIFIEATYQRPWENLFSGEYAYSALSGNAGFGINL
ncbi:MAG: outer membrane beta-barrel protein [Oligoflexia bacterium]|nr:outer membrane beta-barrel protein [Oligoflexia bacterium]